jgi:hypothetical protein
MARYLDQIKGNQRQIACLLKANEAPRLFRVYGSVAGEFINFNVNWGQAITAWWIRHLVIDNGAPQIPTLWLLVQTVKDEANPYQQWETVLAGGTNSRR